MIDNKKLAKEFATIYASTNKAKQLAVAELAKIDEKYRKLAEEEKKSLNETVKMLKSQLEFYGNLLGMTKETPDSVQEEPVEESDAKEAEITDTIFPENNEEKTSDETEVVEEPAAPAAVDTGDAPADDKYADVWPAGDDEQTDEKAEEVKNREFPADDEVKVGADGWPEWPEA